MNFTVGLLFMTRRNQCNDMFFSGMVLNEEKNEVLVIQDKHQVTLLVTFPYTTYFL